MALVWVKFVNELRSHWDVRESLPNMGYVPGLDPLPEELNTKRCLTTIGLKADYAAFVNSSEPDPDDGHCLIGQKLQVFNIGVETAVALDILEAEKAERQNGKEVEDEIVFSSDRNDAKGCEASVASTEIVNNVTEEQLTGKDAVDEMEMPPSGGSPGRMRGNDNVTIVDTLPHKRSFGAVTESPEKEDHSQSRGSSSKLEFYDAEEGQSLLGSTTDDDSVKDTMASVSHLQRRRGARCPVYGVSLVASHDQLYAPYLQRSAPVTDDTILERSFMLSPCREKPLAVHDRIEIAQRLQKPKLLSDMRAFKAANPGAVFQDFIAWYGNPGNPLEDYGDESMLDPVQPNNSSKISAAVKLDNASEAIQILTATRDFFSASWDEASPCAAIDQEPLFDAFSTIEMVLDSFENMHPASLINQIMAVNLATAYFSLVSSAGDTLHVGMVTSALKDLRERTEHALQLLARDATFGTSSHLDDCEDLERLPKHASLQAIRACERACNALCIAETSIARAMSILHKFPRQYDLVQNMLRLADSEPISLDNSEGRNGILHVIHRQQATAETLPIPSLRDYILRNTDEDSPCQLCVRLGDKGAFEGGADGGAVIALTKSSRD